MPRGTPPRPQQGTVRLTLSGGGQSGATGGLGGFDGQDFDMELPIAPEDLQITEPARQSVTNTIGGAYQDHYGQGVSSISLRGHTGWRGRGRFRDGYEAFSQLRRIHQEYNKRCGDGDPADVVLTLTIAIPDGFGSYRVSSDNLVSQRSAQQPLLFRYQFQFTILEVRDGNSFGLQPGGVTAQPQALEQNLGGLFDTQLRAATRGLFTVAPPTVQSAVARPGDTLRTIALRMLGTDAAVTRLEQFNGALADSPLVAGTIVGVPMEGLSP